MFEASSVYFQCVNEQAAQVEIDRVSVGVDLGHGKSPFLIIRSLSTTGVLWMKSLREYKDKRPLGVKDDF